MRPIDKAKVVRKAQGKQRAVGKRPAGSSDAPEERPAAESAPARDVGARKKRRVEAPSASPAMPARGGSDEDDVPLTEVLAKRTSGAPAASAAGKGPSSPSRESGQFGGAVAQAAPSAPEVVELSGSSEKEASVEGAKQEGAEESPFVEVPSESVQGWNALKDSLKARSLLRGVMTDFDWGRTIKRSPADVSLGAYRDLTRLLHAVALMDDGLGHVAEAANAATKKAKELEATLASRDAVIAELEASLQAAKEEASAALTRANSSEGALATAEGALKTAEAKLADREVQVKRGKARIATLVGKLEGAEGQLREEKASSAELSIRLDEVERRADRRVEEAVAAYKDSSLYTEEVEDAASDYYREGYNDCLAKVAFIYPSLDLTGASLAGSEPEGEPQAEGEAADPTAEKGDDGVPAEAVPVFPEAVGGEAEEALNVPLVGPS